MAAFLAYEQIYNYYLPKLYHYVYRFTAASEEDTQDICQEIFIKLWTKRETLSTIGSLDAYLKRAGKNALLDFIKHGKFRNRLYKSYTSVGELSRSVTEENLQFTEYQILAQQAIEQLPEKQRKIFLMRIEQDMSLDEIALQLNLSKSRVKQHVYEAKESIKEFLKKKCRMDYADAVI